MAGGFHLLVALLRTLSAAGFLTPSLLARKPLVTAPKSSACCRLRALPNLLDGSILTAVEVFDGSQIVDPVVVSNVFWVSLKAKLLSVFLGQLLAAMIFGIVVAVAASQVGKVTEFFTSKLVSEQQESGFRKLPRGIIIKKQPDFVKLLVCILIDIIGTSSEVVPLLGELSDIAWAPVAGLLLRYLYGSNVIFALEFAEEILPFTDFLPLATICWAVETFWSDSELARLLQIGAQYSYNDDSEALDPSFNDDQPSSIIDVKVTVDDERHLNRLKARNTKDTEKRP